MNDTPILALARQLAAHPSQRSSGPAASRNIVAIWRERIRLRRALEDMIVTTPHLVGDIGLTRWQVEAEIAKPFWRA